MIRDLSYKAFPTVSYGEFGNKLARLTIKILRPWDMHYIFNVVLYLTLTTISTQV